MIAITSDGGNASVGLTGSAVQQSAGDVALTRLRVPGTMTARVGREFGMDVTAEATTTSDTANATVTLTAAAPDGIRVSIDHSSLAREMHAADSDPRNFRFETEIVCTKRGTWPITWTATINSTENGNTANDVLKRTTQVTCSRANVSSHD